MEMDGLVFRGFSGESYTFSLYRYPTELPKIAAVYVLTKCTTVYDGWNKPVDTIWSAIYFGESGNLHQRFEDHSHKDCFAKHEATHIGIWTRDVSTLDQRLIAERDLVRQHQPPCNQEVP